MPRDGGAAGLFTAGAVNRLVLLGHKWSAAGLFRTEQALCRGWRHWATENGSAAGLFTAGAVQRFKPLRHAVRRRCLCDTRDRFAEVVGALVPTLG